MDKQDIESSSRILSLRERIERKRGQVYYLNVNLKNTDKDRGDYGTVKCRLWNSGEVSKIQAYPGFVKQGKAKLDGTTLTAEENTKNFEFTCLNVSWILLDESAILASDLVQLGDYRFVKAVWDAIAIRTGITSMTDADSLTMSIDATPVSEAADRFFRDTRG